MTAMQLISINGNATASINDDSHAAGKVLMAKPLQVSMMTAMQLISNNGKATASINDDSHAAGKY